MKFLLLIALLLSAIAGAAPRGSSMDVVVRLYHDFAWEVVIDEPHDQLGLIDQPRQVLEKYFDKQLVSLILKDRACVSKTKGICNLDFDPLWDSQDPAATGLKVAATANPHVVKVSFTFPGDSKNIELIYDVADIPGVGRRIHDIHYSSGRSLLSILSQK